MTNLEVVNNTLEAIEQGNFNRASQYLSDDFQFIGPAPVPLGKNDFLAFHEALVAGLPDWRFNQQLRETANGVEGQVAVGGTHTQPLTLPMFGVANFQPTNRRVQNPVEQISMHVANGKITRVEARGPANAGVGGLLTQLGIEMPQG